MKIHAKRNLMGMLLSHFLSTYNQKGLESNEKLDMWVLLLNFQAGYACHFKEYYYLDLLNV